VVPPRFAAASRLQPRFHCLVGKKRADNRCFATFQVLRPGEAYFPESSRFPAGEHPRDDDSRPGLVRTLGFGLPLRGEFGRSWAPASTSRRLSPALGPVYYSPSSRLQRPDDVLSLVSNYGEYNGQRAWGYAARGHSRDPLPRCARCARTGSSLATGTGPKWGCKNAPDSWEGLPVIARGVSKSGHWPDRPDFGEARPAWGAVPECNTGNPATTGRGARTNAPSLGLTGPGYNQLAPGLPPALQRWVCVRYDTSTALPCQAEPLGQSLAVSC